MLIEAYDPQSAIALADRFSFAYLAKLIEQTKENRKPQEDRDVEQLEEWVKENSDRAIEIPSANGTARKINISNFL